MTTKDNLLQPTVLATAPSRKTLCGVPASSSRPAKTARPVVVEEADVPLRHHIG